jgi:uncharacterized protein (TIGR02265 family)
MSLIPDGTSLTPFRGDIDIERLILAVPTGHTIKGAFVASNAAIVVNDWHKIDHLLDAPPRHGKYLAFTDYPLTDFLRVSDAAARKKYPRVATREAHRLLARSTFEIFSQTTLGRVALTLVSGPASLLSKYEEMFNRMLVGPRLAVKAVDARSMELDYVGYYATREAIFGVIEGAVIACHFEPTVTVEAMEAGRFRAQVSWATW